MVSLRPIFPNENIDVGVALKNHELFGPFGMKRMGRSLMEKNCSLIAVWIWFYSMVSICVTRLMPIHL